MKGSYEFAPLPLSNFLDRKFVFPRFQRRSVWKDNQNFELLLSLFKGYPLGVVIVSSEEIEGNKHNYLLDGRQRRTCLQQIQKNPEYIYDWAKKYCKLKSTDSVDEVSDKFWSKVDQFFYQDHESDETVTELEDQSSDFDFTYDSDDIDSESIEKVELGGLSSLLQVIQGIHPKKPKESGLTSPFKLGVDIKNAPARITIDREIGNRIEKVLSGAKCSELYRALHKWLSNEELDFNETNTWQWVAEQNMFNNAIKAEQDLVRKWSSFVSAYKVIRTLDDLLSKSSIGLVEAKNYSDTDRQMIFKFINDGGTPLTSVQILSASPYWNKRISDSGQLDENRTSLYGLMELPFPKDPVRWDCAACAPSFLDLSGLLKIPALGQGNFDKRLKTGFKLYALHRSQSLNKQAIQELGTDDLYWKTPLLMRDRYQKVIKRLYKTEYFKYMTSWKGSLEQLTSENAAMFYLEAVTLRYEYYEMPESGKKYYQWLNDAFALIDRLVLEVVEMKWKGSSDALLARKLKASKDINWSLVGTKDWKVYLDEANSKGTINGNEIDQKLSEKIVRHMTFVNKMFGTEEGEIEHIIPKSKVVDEELRHLINAPLNLSLISSSLNRAKSDSYPFTLSDSDGRKYSLETMIPYESLEKLNEAKAILNLSDLRASFYRDFEKNRSWHYSSQDH